MKETDDMAIETAPAPAPEQAKAEPPISYKAPGVMGVLALLGLPFAS